MCTAVSFLGDKHYFGRNLDIECSYHESVIITPRNYEFFFRHKESINEHYAMIGIGIVSDDYPLYFDATNEKGVSIAGLNFPDYAKYYKCKSGFDNIAPFELIPWILSQCKDILEVKKLLLKINIINENFKENMPLTPLHWIIADKLSSITLETTAEGMKIYDNPVGVLTNNPTFDMQMFNLNNYMSITKGVPKNSFSDKLNLSVYSNGMGGLGLPGDLSSASRFVKASFTKLNSVTPDTEYGSISQFFHILGSVYQERGCVEVKKGLYEITRYSSCCNTDEGIFYYKTYNNNRLSAVDMNKENLDINKLITYKITDKEDIFFQN